MAYYNANEMVRLTRIAMDITQEELSDRICDVSTLSKMENGHFRIKQTTYRKLMEKMGRVTEKKYAKCIDNEGKILEERLEWERTYKSEDFERAERYLRNIQEIADDNILTRQYMTRAEALLDYRLGCISAEELINRLDGAIRMTVPDYEKYLAQDSVFPFLKEELLALMSLGNAYRKVGENARGVQIYEGILRCLNADYINEPDKGTMAITVKYNIARMHGEMGRHIDALSEIENCLKLCKERDYSHLTPRLLFEKAHNYMIMIDKNELGKEWLGDVKKLLQQAYGLAAAREEKKTMLILKRYYERYVK